MPGQEAKYQQVIDWVKRNIEDGTFREGDKLMSENEMSSRFGLSRQTIRRATGELVNQKLVTRMQGSGTYIGSQLPEALQTENADSMAPAEADLRRPHMNIAVISTFNESYIFPGILKGIGEVLTDHGYAMQVSFTDNRLNREAAILQMLLEKDSIDGLIVEPVKSALPNPNPCGVCPMAASFKDLRENFSSAALITALIFWTTSASSGDPKTKSNGSFRN